MLKALAIPESNDRATISFDVETKDSRKYQRTFSIVPTMAKLTRDFLTSESQLTKKVATEIRIALDARTIPCRVPFQKHHGRMRGRQASGIRKSPI